MRKKLLSLLLITALCFGVVLSAPVYVPDSVAEAASYTLTKPTIKAVKNVDDSYLKITWNDTKDAEKYYVYRATSKDGKYKKIATTTKTFYKDKKVKNNKRYYYKIRGINDDERSKLSGYKSGKITFDGEITLSDTSLTIGLGETVTVHVGTHGCDDYVVADFDEEWLEAEWYSTDSETMYELDITCHHVMSDSYSTEVKIYFQNHENIYSETIEITIEDPLLTNMHYPDYNNVPDLGLMLGINYNNKGSDASNTYYMYDYSTIQNAGFEIKNVIDGYSYLLTAGYGYTAGEVLANDYGGLTYFYYTTDRTVGIFNAPNAIPKVLMICISK